MVDKFDDDKLVNSLLMAGHADNDGDMEIEVDDYCFYINKQEAVEIIEHLKSVFDI